MNYERDAKSLMEDLLEASRECGKDDVAMEWLAEDLLPDTYDLDSDTMNETNYHDLLQLIAAWRRLPRPDGRSRWIWTVAHKLFVARVKGCREVEAEEARGIGRPKAFPERRPMDQARALMRDLVEASKERRWDGQGGKEQRELEARVRDLLNASGYRPNLTRMTANDPPFQIPLAKCWKKLPTPDDHTAWIWAAVFRLLEEFYASEMPIPVASRATSSGEA